VGGEEVFLGVYPIEVFHVELCGDGAVKYDVSFSVKVVATSRPSREG